MRRTREIGWPGFTEWPEWRTFCHHQSSWKPEALVKALWDSASSEMSTFLSFAAPSSSQELPRRRAARGWAVITVEWAQKISSAQGRPPVPGDKIQLSFFRNQTFAIREATIAGIIRYMPTNDALKSVVIMDARILRALCGYLQISGEKPAAGSGSSGEPGSTGDVDSLFPQLQALVRPMAAPHNLR